MNVMLFLLVSLIVHSIPIPFSSDMLQPSRLIKWLPLRLVWGTVAWGIIVLFMMMTLPWAILGLIMSLGLLLIISSGFRPGELEEMVRGLRAPLTCFGLLVVMLMPMFTGLIGWTSDVSNAQYFDTMIAESDEPLFNSTIPDEMVRLVTEEYAAYVANQHISPFGSNVQVSAAHITTRAGRLVWVCTIVSTNVLAENFVKGFIVVDANDPQAYEPEVITSTTIPVGEGLWWDRDIRFSNYLNDMSAAYQYAYPTWDPLGELAYVQTRTPLRFDFVERAIGPTVYFENGTVVSYGSIEETPDWITQAYAEEWLEREVSRWGGYRRGTTFDLFAGGLLWFIPPSNDRLEMTEDTRYIANPDSGMVEAFIAVHPVGNPEALAGVFRATQDTVFYHDLSAFGYVSGDAAAANVVGQLPPPATGFYYGAMPLLYPVEINPTEIKWTWYTPIYWAQGYYDDDADEFLLSDMRLHALALVDASNIDKFYIQELGGALSGATLVQAARADYVALFGGSIGPGPGDAIDLNATVVNVTPYVEDGDTHIVLGTDNSTYPYIEGARAWMNLTDWYTLLNLNPTDGFLASLQEIEGQYRIIAIVKL
ncbi:MAG: hypothetical protein AM324_002560 [Candidatus Thorarchaeota archaeon SMTZ1-83]